MVGGILGLAALAGMGYGFFRCAKRVPDQHLDNQLVNVNQTLDPNPNPVMAKINTPY